MAETKPKKKRATSKVRVDPAPSVGPPPDPPKIVLKDRHALRDPKAKKLVRCKTTLNHRTACGVVVSLRKGKEVLVPALSVEDLRRSGLIH